MKPVKEVFAALLKRDCLLEKNCCKAVIFFGMVDHEIFFGWRYFLKMFVSYNRHHSLRILDYQQR